MSTSEDILPNVILTFEFDDEGLPSLEPYEFHLDETLSKPYRLQVSLVARDPSIEESKLVGHGCTLTMSRAGLVRYVNGIVLDATFSGVALDAMTPEGNLPTGLIHLTVVPALELLKQRRNNRIFQPAKVTAVLKEVLEEALGDYGREVTMKTSSPDYKELEYCTQFDETDFEFVKRLMATHGIMSYFIQEEKAERLVLFDSADQYLKLLTLDHGKVPFETQFQEGNLVETVVRFTMDTRLTPTTATVRAFNWSKAGDPDETPSQGKDSLDREREWYLGEAPVALESLGDDGVYAKTSAVAQAKLIRQTAVARTNVAQADGNVSGVSPGVTFELDNALRDNLNQEYLVIHASHRGLRPGERRKGTFNAEVGEVMYSNTFRCVPSDVLFRLETPPRRFIQTMQTAVVVGDEDITTDVHGRIKVQFHWDRQGKNNLKSSCWVRVAQASAGIGFGSVFIPRKGQEVVVSFLEGDPDKPLVIGSVYNGINTPPYTLPDEKTRSVIRTRSTPDDDGYNEISFEDNKGSEQLYIQAQKDLKALVKHDHEVLIKNDERLTVSKNQTEDIGESQTLTVGGTRSRHVKKDEDVTIDGNQSLTIKGGGSSSVHSAVNVTGKHTLDASDTIKFTAPTSITFECGGSTIVMEPGKITLTAGGGATMVLDANVEATSSGKSSLKLDTDAAMQGTMNASVTGSMEATMSATPGSVKASPTGVEVSGPKVDVSGTAMVNISGVMVKIN
jgi:type VI secretion system secreted protein VgrG